MTIINLNTEIHTKVGEFIKDSDGVEFPSIKNFVDKAVKEKLEKEEKKK